MSDVGALDKSYDSDVITPQALKTQRASDSRHFLSESQALAKNHFIGYNWTVVVRAVLSFSVGVMTIVRIDCKR